MVQFLDRGLAFDNLKSLNYQFVTSLKSGWSMPIISTSLYASNLAT